MVKRFVPAVLISPALLLPLACLMVIGCADKKGGEAAAQAAAADDRVIAASFYPMYIAALNVTENVRGVRVVNMAPAAARCLHDYQMTAADAVLLEKAEVLIINGIGLDTFLDKAAASNENLTVINTSDLIPGGGCVNDPKQKRHHHNHHNHEHHHHHRDKGDDICLDPHIWMSIDNHIRQITHIAEKLAEWDTVNANIYADNARRYTDRLTALTAAAYNELSTAVNRYIVISHSGFIYLAEAFSMKVAATVEREAGVEPGAAEIIKAVNTIKREKAKAIFVEKGRHSPASKTISAETGVPIFELDMIVSGPDDKDAYVNAMKKNISTLTEALK